MKKGNKVLALFLAAVMLATSIAWDFGEVKAETTEEITSQIETKEDGVSIDFDNIDVAELDANGYVSTKFKGGEAVQGEVNQPVSKHWFSGEGDDTPYGDAGTIKSKNIGLKTKDTETDDTKTVMYTPYSYEDFQISAEIYYGAYSGIVLGEKNVYPDGVTSPSVALFFNSGRIHIMGAVERSTAKIMRGTSAAIADNGSALGYKIFNNGEGDTIKANPGGTYTVNVKKTGNHLLVWISGGAGLMSIELSDSYKTGWLGIQSRCYDGDGGGFKSLNIEKVHAVEHHELNNVSLTELDDAGYSYTFSDNKILNKASDAIKSVDGILKGITTGSSMSSLNIPYIYKNFRFEAEIYPEQAFGVAMGKISSVPLAGSGLVCAYFNSSQLEIRGAVTATGAQALGGGTGTVSNASMFKLDSYDAAGKKYVRNSSQLVTIVVEVKGNTATAWLEDYDGYVSLPITTSYAAEKISLIGRSAGGFKSYTITNLDAGYSADFDNVNLTNLDAAGYTASDCADSEFEDKAVSEVWFSGQSGYSTSEANKNDGLKPNDTTAKDGNIDLLNLPKVYENFRLKTTMYHGQVVGVAIGKKGVKPSASSGTDNGVVTIYTNSKYIELRGAINKSSVNLTAGSEETNNSSLYHYVPVGHSADWNKEKTLVVEMQDGILTVWMEGYAGILRVRVTDNYVAGNIALIARRPDTDGVNAGGGLKSYTIEKLPATNNINTTVDVAGYTDFDFVDTSVLEAKGFSVSKFKTDGTVVATDATVGTHMYAGEVGVSSAGKVAYNKSHLNSGLKSNSLGTDEVTTVLNTPYTATNGYEDFSASLEAYWGVETGIVLGTKNVLPTKATSSIMIYFNSNHIQISGGGIDPSSALIKGGTGVWNVSYDPTFIFKPDADFEKVAGKVFDLSVEMKDGTVTVWVEGCDTVLSFNTTKEFTHDKVAIMSRCYDGEGGGLKSFEIEALDDEIVKAYDAESFATFRSTNGHTAPEYKNYLFAGWFTEASCTVETAIASDVLTVEADTTVYAKFVPRYILTVKAQVSADLVDDEITADDGEGEIRFVTTVDSPNYSQVGFRVAYDKDRNGVVDSTHTIANKAIYSSLKAFGTYEYVPTDICDASTYFKAVTVKKIQSEYFDVLFSVTPFWKTLDGTEVQGDTVAKSVSQGMSVEQLGGKTALFVGDSIQDGANYAAENMQYKGWYDRLARYYGIITEEVASKGWALTNKETSGRSQIVTQLESAKKTSYDFIILEGGVNDVRIDQDKQTPDIVIDWGSVDEDPNKADYGDSTIAGAMQNLIIATQKKFPDAEVVYLINHYFGATDANMKKYVAMVKAACRVHSISYVDLSDTEAHPTLAPLTKQSAEYISDNLHPKAAGYELSTPVIAEHLRKLVTGELVDAVYVSNKGTDAVGYGTAEAPYQTLNYALDKVADGGTVYVQDALVCTNGENSTSFHLGGSGVADGKNIESSSNIIDKVNHKQVTIAGANDQAKLSFPVTNSGATYLFLNDSIILKDIQVEWPSRIFAEGNTFIVESSVKQVGSKEPMLMGGSNYHDLEKTDLRIYAGTYPKIVGGSVKNTIGETNVIVGGNVNSGIDTSSHNHTYVLLGGSYSEGANCTISGNTNVVVEQGAKFNYVFGGGAVAGNDNLKSKSSVLGDTNVSFAGEALSVYGGACARLVDGTADKTVPCNNTNVTIKEGAKVQQVFGGSEYASINGSVNMQLLGGEITRRVYGGSYNGTDGSTSYYANGTIVLAVAPEANLTLNTDTDNSFSAISRHKKSSANEKGVFIFSVSDTTNINKVGIGWDAQLGGIGSKTHDHLVKVDANGTAKVVDGKLIVLPNSGYTIASVTGATDNGDRTYTLTNAEVVVTFATAN